MYVTVSHIQDSPGFNQGWANDSFALFEFALQK